MVSKRQSGGSQWLRYVALPLGILALVVALRLFVLLPFRVQTRAIEPKLREGAWAFALQGKTPRIGDIVLFEIAKVTGNNERQMRAVARVVALPGDSVELRDGVLWVNAHPQRDYRLRRTHESYALRLPREGGVYPISPLSLVAYRTALIEEERLGLVRDRKEHLGTNLATWIEALRRNPYRTFYRDYYWVLVDDPSEAPDSRHLGIIPSDAIEGIVFFSF